MFPGLRFIETHPELFRFRKATEVHPHDVLLVRIMLRFIPEWITPNIVTMVRVLMTPVVFLLILFGTYRTGVILFLFAASTDAIDGSLARTRHQITRFGMLFDPLADKFLIGSVVLILVFQNFSPWLGVALLGFEIALIASGFVATFHFKKVVQANWWGKVKMMLQVVAIFLTLLALLLGYTSLFTVAAWLFGIAIGFAAMSLFRAGV